MKMISLKCPSCGGGLSVEQGRDFTFCQYCGTKILFEDENMHTYRHIDDADIKRAETERIVKLKELELEQDKRKGRKALIISWAVATGFLLIFGVLLMALNTDNTVGAITIMIGFNVGLWGAMFLFTVKNEKTKSNKAGSPEINKRANNDNSNQSSVKKSDNYYDVDLGDMFKQAFPTFSGESSKEHSEAKKGNDLRCQLIIDPAEAARGTTKTIQLVKANPCQACNGSGVKYIPTTGTCTVCNGKKKVPQPSQTLFGMTMVLKTCPACGGRDTAIKKTCEQCNGTGKLKVVNNLSVVIPAGTSNGKVLSVKGEGEAGLNGGSNGDLLIDVMVINS